MGLFTRGRNGHDPTFNVRELVDQGLQRQDDLRKQDRKHTESIGALRAKHAKEIRVGESSRINAILAAAAVGVQRAAEVQQTAAISLAGQVAAAAEAMRTTVAAAATATATSLTSVVGPIIKDVSELRQAMYQQQGEKAQQTEGRDTNQWVISSIILGASVLIGAGALLLSRQQGQRQVRNDNGRNNQWLITTAVAITVGIVGILALLGHLQ